MNGLKSIRKKRGYTQQKLSELSGVNRVNIAQYERNLRRMGLDTAIKLAKALECSIEAVIQRDANNQGSSDKIAV